MCFSKEASYSTGAILVAIGSYTILSNKQKKLMPVACIPLFFGIQQFAEGALWSSFEAGLPIRVQSFENLTDPNTLSAVIFLFFAFLIWPIWIPLSALLPEKLPYRRKFLKAALGVGIAVGGVSLLSLIENQITIKIYEHSIQYLLAKPLRELQN